MDGMRGESIYMVMVRRVGIQTYNMERGVCGPMGIGVRWRLGGRQGRILIRPRHTCRLVRIVLLRLSTFTSPTTSTLEGRDMA